MTVGMPSLSNTAEILTNEPVKEFTANKSFSNVFNRLVKPLVIFILAIVRFDFLHTLQSFLYLFAHATLMW